MIAQALGDASLGTTGRAEPDGCLLTVLIPCLNEAETLSACVRDAAAFLRRANVNGEVLVADNGSTDGSQALATQAGARVIKASVRGYGGALAAGIAEARGEYVIMGDADDSYDLSDLQGFLSRLEGGADLVMGNRFRGGIAAGAMPLLHRYLGNPVLTWIGRLLFPSPVNDFHCGLRGFRRDSIAGLGLRTTGMEFASEMVVRATLAGLQIAEVPTTLRRDGRSRPPHLKTWRDGWRHLKFLLLHSPRWTFGYPGAALISGGLSLMLIQVNGPVRLLGQLVLGSHTMLVAAMAIMLGVQLITFAVIARRHALQRGILPERARRHGLLRLVTLERILITSALLFAAGVGGFGWLLVAWRTCGIDLIHSEASLRALLLCSCVTASGIQLGFSAFLLGMFDLPGDDLHDRVQALRLAADALARGGPSVS